MYSIYRYRSKGTQTDSARDHEQSTHCLLRRAFRSSSRRCVSFFLSSLSFSLSWLLADRKSDCAFRKSSLSFCLTLYRDWISGGQGREKREEEREGEEERGRERGRGREREREREKERKRERGRKREREKEREKGREGGRGREGERERENSLYSYNATQP